MPVAVFFVAVSKSTIRLTTKFYEIWRTFLVTLFCLLYSCDGAIGHVKMFDEMFGAFDHPRSNIAKFWLFFQFQYSVKCSARLTEALLRHGKTKSNDKRTNIVKICSFVAEKPAYHNKN